MKTVGIIANPNSGKDIRRLIAPGLMADVAVSGFRPLICGERVAIRSMPCVVALDGEREHFLGAGGCYSVRLNATGPWVVDVETTLALVTDDATARRSTAA